MGKTFVLNDENVNNYGYWVKTSGIDLTQFRKNPIMLWMHNRSWSSSKEQILPIGRWENIRIEGTKLLADAVFDENDPFAKAIADKVENGFIKMASLSALPITMSDDKAYLKPGQTRAAVIKSKMKEASIVDMGGNDNSLCLVDDNGNIYELDDKTRPFPVPLLNQKNPKKMDEVIKVLKLAADANEETAVEKIQLMQDTMADQKARIVSLTDKVKAFEDKEKENQKAEAVKLTDEAIADGRIDAKAKEAYLKLFDSDHDSTKLALESIPKRTSAAAQISQEKRQESDNYAALEKLSYEDIDKKGKVKELRAFPELYKAKYKEAYGVEPRK